MSLLTLAGLLIEEAKDAIYDRAIGFAETLGLPVTSWQTGDPTRSLYHVVSEILATLETIAVGFISSGFLDYAEDDWLTLEAEQVYNVPRTEATYAPSTITLTNAGGGLYVIGVGDLTVINTTTGKTYHNTEAGTLQPAGSVDDVITLDIIADEAGSDSSSGVGEIDDLVTTLLGVTVTNPTAAVGIDAESDAALRQRCRDKLGSLSPNGPSAAYSYVALNPDLTGISTVTRSRVFGDTTTGDVTVYLATASGGVSGADVTAVEEALATYATPLCVTLTVASAGTVNVPVTYSLWIYRGVNKTQQEVEDAVEDALGDMFAARPIGGDIIPPDTTGKLYHSMILSTIRNLYPDYAFRVTVTAPAGDTALTNSQVAILGTVTPTVTFVDNPL